MGWLEYGNGFAKWTQTHSFQTFNSYRFLVNASSFLLVLAKFTQSNLKSVAIIDKEKSWKKTEQGFQQKKKVNEFFGHKIFILQIFLVNVGFDVSNTFFLNMSWKQLRIKLKKRKEEKTMFYSMWPFATHSHTQSTIVHNHALDHISSHINQLNAHATTATTTTKKN